MFSEKQIKFLLSGVTISDKQPWVSGDRASIASYYEKLIEKVCMESNLLDITEISHYEIGISSYIDCFFYRDTEPFRNNDTLLHWGLNILFSGQAPYYVVGEGEIGLSEQEMLCYEVLDEIEHACVQEIVEPVCNILNQQGHSRLFHDDLSQFLPPELEVPTILSLKPFRHFDALFHTSA